jgi:Flp pilus assembly protein TadD
MKILSRSALKRLAAVALVALWAVFAAHAHPVLADATDEEAASLDTDFAAGKQALAAKNWTAAVAAFRKAVLRDPRNADLENYLGFAYRNLGQMEQAFAHYEKALSLNPRHRGAHEYLGEAYLQVGDLAKAQAHLASLEKICLLPCEEYGDLKAAIDAYAKKQGK